MSRFENSERFGHLFAPKQSAPVRQKASAVGGGDGIQFQRLPKAGTMRQGYETYSKEGYQLNAVVFRCISLIAQGCGAFAWKVKRNGEDVDNHDVLRLLKRPNPMTGGSLFIESAVSYRLLDGNTYIEGVGIGKSLRELYVHRPDWIEPAPSPDGIVREWKYNNGKRKHTFTAETGSPSPILHIRTFNPLDQLRGMSPLQPGALNADAWNDATKWNKSVMKNQASPSGALVTPDNANLTDHEYSRLQGELEEKYTGSLNAKKPMILEGGLKWVQMMLNAQEMDWLNGLDYSAKYIAMSFNVPEQLVGVKGQQTYNNYREARLALYEDAILPIMYAFGEELSWWLSSWYGEDLTLVVDEDSVPAMALKQEMLWDRVEKSERLTINEKREMLGNDPINGGDTLFVPATNVPLPMAASSDFGASDMQKAYELAYGKK